MRFDPHKAKASRKWKSKHGGAAAGGAGGGPSTDDQVDDQAESSEEDDDDQSNPASSSTIVKSTSTARPAKDISKDSGQQSYSRRKVQSNAFRFSKPLDDDEELDIDRATKDLLDIIKSKTTEQPNSAVHFKFKQENLDWLDNSNDLDDEKHNKIFELDPFALGALMMQLPMHERCPGLKEEDLIYQQPIEQGVRPRLARMVVNSGLPSKLSSAALQTLRLESQAKLSAKATSALAAKTSSKPTPTIQPTRETVKQVTDTTQEADLDALLAQDTGSKKSKTSPAPSKAHLLSPKPITTEKPTSTKPFTPKTSAIVNTKPNNSSSGANTKFSCSNSNNKSKKDATEDDDLKLLDELLDILQLMLLLLTLIVAMTGLAATALHEDQAGLFDWHKELIGIPKFTSFQRVGKKAQLVFGTEKNVIAAVNPKDGKIIWRQLLPSNDKLLYLSADDQTVLTVSGQYNPHVRLWDSSSGYLIWDHTTEEGNLEVGSGGCDVLSIAVAGTTIEDLLVLTPTGHVTRISGKMGTRVWQSTLDSSLFNKFTKLAVSGSSVFAVGYKRGGEASVDRGLVVQEMDLRSGSKKSLTPSATWNYLPRDKKKGEFFFASTVGVQNSTYLVWNAAKSASPIMAMKLGTDALVPVDVKSTVFGKDADVVAKSLKARNSEFVLQSSLASAVVRITQTDGPSLPSLVARFDPLAATVKHFSATSGLKSPALAARLSNIRGSSASILDVIDIESGETLGSFEVPVNANECGSITSSHLDSVAKSGSAPGFRVLVTTEGGCVSMVRSKELLWSRDESLADVSGSVFVDLPEPDLLSLDKDELDEPLQSSEALGPIDRYQRRWATHIAKLQKYFASLPSKLEKLSSFGSSNGKGQAPLNVTNPVKDKLGFRKYIVFVSSKGMAHALESEHGTVVWRRWLRATSNQRIEVVRTAVVRYPPVAVVISDHNEGTSFRHINLLTGSDYSFQGLPKAVFNVKGKPSQVLKLPVHENLEETKILAFIGADSKLRVFPPSEQAWTAFEGFAPKFYYYNSAVGARNITGFTAGGRKSDQNGVYFDFVRSWSLEFPEGETLADMAARPKDEHHASMGRVLGDRSVLYKYLNPNFLALATLRQNPIKGTSNAYLYLLDSVTGTLFYKSAYLGVGNVATAVDSIHLLQVDNSVVFTYYNLGPDSAELLVEPDEPSLVEAGANEDAGGRKKRTRPKKRSSAVALPDVKGYEISVLEVFENKKPDNRMKSPTYSSFTNERPAIMTQTYMFQFPITAIGTTITGAGITTREILFGLANDQLFGVNRRLLDPRRTLGAPTADDREEMLIPYRPVIDYNPREVASYTLSVIGIEEIHSSPTALESTSLAVAYGVDIFFTRRAPSKAFDVLSEDFNYVSLIATIIALAASIEVAKYFAQRKKLVDQWA